MSKGKSAIFWELRKSIGQHKFSTRPDGEIIGSMKGKKDPTYKDPAKREKRDLRIAGYGGSGKVTRVLKVILREGFLERKRNQSPANAFVQKNVKTLCTATRDKDTKEIVLEYDFDNMSVSSGSLDAPNVDVAVNLEEGIVTFTQTAEVIPGGLARDDDKLFACLFSVNNATAPSPPSSTSCAVCSKPCGKEARTASPPPSSPRAGTRSTSSSTPSPPPPMAPTPRPPSAPTRPPRPGKSPSPKSSRNGKTPAYTSPSSATPPPTSNSKPFDGPKKRKKLSPPAPKRRPPRRPPPFEAKLTGLRAGIDRLKGI